MTIEERRRREKDVRRDSAIKSANRLFYLKGYENVSMDEIAREADLGKTTLNKYFEDKETLFFAVVNRGTEIFNAIITEEEERTQTTCAKFGLLKTASNRFFLEYPDYANYYLVFRSGRYGTTNDGNMKSAAKEINEFIKKCYEKGISEIKTGRENGILRPDINPVVVFVLNILIQDSTLTMSSDLRQILNAHGVSTLEFYMEADNLLFGACSR
jgi:TetR/AcrR family transcriptional regulator